MAKAARLQDLAPGGALGGVASHSHPPLRQGLLASPMAWQGLVELQQWVTLEARRMQTKERHARIKNFRDKLEEKYPGSLGLMHRVTKWKAAWQAPINSITKKPVAQHPQDEVEEELQAWCSEWSKACPAGEAPLWRQARGRDCPQQVNSEARGTEAGA